MGEEEILDELHGLDGYFPTLFLSRLVLADVYLLTGYYIVNSRASRRMHIGSALGGKMMIPSIMTIPTKPRRR